MNHRSLHFYVLHLCFILPSTLAEIGQVLWRDDFDWGNSPNVNYWSYDLGGGGWGNQELQTYTTGAVSVSGGLLNIRAERISTGFTSGRIKTDGKMTFQYGTLEARIKTPDVADGLWPAFWTLGSNFEQVGWPRSGEIDIMEIGQGLAITEGVVNRRVISGAHWEFEEKLAAYALWKTFNVNLNEDFHIYRLDWTPTTLSTYVDGVRVWEMDIDSANCVDCEEFHQPHFVLLNLAVGGLFTSTGGAGSSSASSSSSSSAACSSSASSASSSSSSGGCGQPRIDVSAPLPANMQVDWVQIVDNGFAQVFPTGAPTPNPTPTVDRSGALSTKAPTKRPTPNPTPSVVTAFSTKSPTRRPTPNPTRNPTPQPTPQPVGRVGPLSTKSPTRRPTRNPTPHPTPRPPTRNPTPHPTPHPVPPTPRVFEPVGYYGKGGGKGGGPVGGKGGKGNTWNGYDYVDHGKGGKGGKGKGGKSGSSSSSSKKSSSSSGKGGKGKGGKGSSKGSKKSGSYTTLSSALEASAAPTLHQTQAIMTILSLALMLVT
ncbi:unnamed protein product [Cylindrotheca closterium]|uniref:GH16 domain-containing protein n=1 Tax=Cylindrotheca closterium TaxID=2856 RepID=A0AAD2FXC5_9STRA|nr:unnamed protein product [Cylindrotheca closterium]